MGVKLTKSYIDAATYEGADCKNGKSRDVRWDNTLPGFGVRIYPSGKKSFILIYRNQFNQKRQMTIGDYGIFTLTQARAEARKFIGQVKIGTDPLAERKENRQAATFGELCKTYMDRHAKAKKKSWKKDESRISRHLLPVWKSRAVQSITHEDVAALHEKIGRKTPYEANRTLEQIRKMFNLAEQWGYVPGGFRNPAVGHDRFKEKKRDRWIRPEEMPQLASELKKEVNPYVRGAIILYLLTGLRKNELMSIQWEDIDFQRKEVLIRDPKNGEDFYQDLSTPALEVIRNLPRLDENPYLMPGKKKGRPLTNIDKNWARIRQNAGLEDVRLHDLRRTVGSWFAVDGFTELFIGKVLHQKSREATRVYARLSENPIREALEDYGQKMFGVLETPEKLETNNLH